MKYINEPAFINRSRELHFLVDWLKERPKKMLFLYGPKSSGKTTLLYHLRDHLLDPKQYEVKYLNLRETLIVNYENFIQALFGLDYEQSEDKEIRALKEYNFKIFKLSSETLHRVKERQLDPFHVMKQELQKLQARGICPVLVVDELQALEGIYTKGQRELIKELFNFFVSITKESHLAHVLLSSSDGYFVEQLYNDSKLRKTSDFLLVDYLNKKDVFYWFTHLKEESALDLYTLSESQIERIWQGFGGSPWEISAILGDLIRVAHNGSISDEDLEKSLQPRFSAACVFFWEYREKYYKRPLFLALDALFQKSKTIRLSQLLPYPFEESKLLEELGQLVQKSLISFNPVTGEYAPQGESIRHGLHAYCEELRHYQLDSL